MHIWQWIIVIFLYGAVCTGLTALTGIDVVYFFWGGPILLLLIVIYVVISAESEPNDRPLKSTKSSNNGIKITRQEFLKRTLKGIEYITKNNKKSQSLSDELIRLIKQLDPEYAQHSTAQRIENLYLGLRQRNDSSCLIACLNIAFFDGNLGNHEPLRDKANNLVQNLSKLITDQISDSDAQAMLKNTIAPILKEKAKKFPTDLFMVNVRAIPNGSFLEDAAYSGKQGLFEQEILPQHYPISALRNESENLKQAAEDNALEYFMRDCLEKAKQHAKKSLEKKLLCEKLNASDIKNCTRWCSILCLSSYYPEIQYAETKAQKIYENSCTLPNQSNALTKALENLKDFIDSSKGVDDEKAKFGEELKIQLNDILNTIKETPNFNGQDIYTTIINLGGEVLDYSYNQGNEEIIHTLIEILKIARLNIASLENSVEQIEISKQLMTILKSANAKIKKEN